jgi:O-antigen ligase
MLALACEGAVILVSVATHGQNSAGAFYGYLEIAAVTTVALILVVVRPRLSQVLLGCAAGGAFIGCFQALVTDNTTSTLHGASGRLTGYYGNPNFLGFAGSLAVPIFLTFALRTHGRRAIPYWFSLAVILISIALSFSRGAVLAAAAGVIAVISLRKVGARRRLRTVGVSCVVFGVLAAIGYPLYLHLRTHADFAPATSAGDPDRSGWDPRAQGLIPAGPSTLRTTVKGALRIVAPHAGEGASFPLGDAREGQRYQIALLLSSTTAGLEVGVGLEDNLLGAGPATVTTLLTPAPRSRRLQWAPTLAAPNARLYVWLPRGGAITLSALTFSAVGARPSSLPLRLLGPSDRSSTQQASESRYVHSREDAASLAWRLFRENPLTGVGWQRFTSYSATRLHYGPLATHNEYLRYASELGLLGLVFLLIAIAAVAHAAMRIDGRTIGVAAAACALAAAVGLGFVNALEVPSIALPLAVSVAVLCTDDGRDQVMGPRG